MDKRGKYERTQEHRELRRQQATKHGLSRTPTWWSWRGMRKRCLDPKNKSYANYAGRGITICPEWDSFEQFLADMGERPDGTTLDRINNDGNYEPGNCRWADPSVQRKNQRRGPARMADCHPDRPHVARGLCNACYKKRQV